MNPNLASTLLRPGNGEFVLQDLDLSDNLFHGTLPSYMFSVYTNIEHLSMSLNLLSGTIPISDWVPLPPSLRTLLMSNNYLSASMQAVMDLFASLEVLDLSHQNIYGSIPAWSSAPPARLRHIKLEDVDIVGSLPGSWVQFASTLQIIELSGNSFIDTIPESWENLTILERLDLSHNQLSGPVPEFGNPNGSMWNLQSLVLGNNLLTGTIPCSLTNLNLKKLILSNNSMTGLVPDPANVSNWENINFLYDGGDNSFTGLSSEVCSTNAPIFTKEVWGVVYFPDANPSQLDDLMGLVLQAIVDFTGA